MQCISTGSSSMQIFCFSFCCYPKWQCYCRNTWWNFCRYHIRSYKSSFTMLAEFAENLTVYIVTGYTDMRKSIDGLASIVQGILHMDPFSKSMFLFCGRRRDRIKALLWEDDRFVLLYKRWSSNAEWLEISRSAKILQQAIWDRAELQRYEAGRTAKIPSGTGKNCCWCFLCMAWNIYCQWR